MSTSSSPARPTPRKQQTARMSTGGRRPPKGDSSSQFVDDEAAHDSDGSNGEENGDKYESDFINDAVQEGEPIKWPDSPPRAEENADDSDGDAASNNEDQPALVKRLVKKNSAADSVSPATPMITRILGHPVFLVLSPMLFDSARIPEILRVPLKLSRILLVPVNVVMGEAEHEAYLLFKQSRQQPTSSAELSPSYQTPIVKKKHRAPPHPTSNTDSISNRATPTNAPRSGSALSTLGSVPAPSWNVPNIGRSQDVVEDGDMDDVPSADSEQTGDSTATDGSRTLKRKQPASPSKSAMKAGGSSLKRKRTETGDTLTLNDPGTPAVHFDSSKIGSSAKKQKEEAPELHTIDAKTCSELPDVCEVTDPTIQDAMMKPIYGLQLPRLKKCQVTTWSSSEGPGMFELSYYPVINPKLSIDTVWALLLFIKHGPKKRWVMSIDEKPAVCVSIVNCVQSSLLEVSTVGQAASPLIPLLKFITGVHLSQDFERIVGLCGMVFQLDLMHVQLHMSALTFGTKGIPIEQYENLESKVHQPGVKSSANIYKKNTYVPSNDSLNWNDPVPVYDARFTAFDAAVDIDNLDKILPVYDGDIPSNCCTAVGYTISHYVKYNAKGRAQEDHISFNLQWAVVLGEPEE
ncbi:hypothetical protein B0H14DRAFT_2608967 [Mycena olivaceomarginata]|nr:hypothetical protein B0H14DRAFT_2608967 [Mycena olivaceomarginata]